MKPVFNLGLAFMLGITPVIAAEPETGAPYSGTERSQEGPGGIIDVSGVMVLEFDWSAGK